jgi:hypothetical protein
MPFGSKIDVLLFIFRKIKIVRRLHVLCAENRVVKEMGGCGADFFMFLSAPMMPPPLKNKGWWFRR